MKERPNGSWIVNHQTNDVIRRRFCRWKNTKRRIYFEGTLFRIEGIAVKGVDWYWIPVLLQLVIVAVTIEYISVYRFVYYHLTVFFQSDFQLFLRTNVIIHSLPRELKSIRLQNYDSGVCTFIDFKLWFTVLNDRYREISLTMSGSVECWCYHWHVPIWINHNQMHSKHDENASHALV